MKIMKSSGSHLEQSKNKHQIQEPNSANKSEIKPASTSQMEASLKKKPKPRYCGVCMENKTKLTMFKSTTCRHSFCKNCISSHVSAKISDGITKVNCPEPECKAELEPQECRSFVPKSVVERWDMMICELLIGTEKIYCPFKDCSAVLALEDRDRDVTSAECPHCHRLFCAQCRVPWHSGLQCAQFKGDRIMDKKFVEIATREKWQKCPSCRFYVQRSSGCESIKCRCGCNFCYQCGDRCSFGHICRRDQRLYVPRNWEYIFMAIICIWSLILVVLVLVNCDE